MKNNFTKNYKYLISSQRDEDWDINVNTVGCETIEKNYETYPPRTGHPAQFFFTPSQYKGSIILSWFRRYSVFFKSVQKIYRIYSY